MVSTQIVIITHKIPCYVNLIRITLFDLIRSYLQQRTQNCSKSRTSPWYSLTRIKCPRKTLNSKYLLNYFLNQWNSCCPTHNLNKLVIEFFLYQLHFKLVKSLLEILKDWCNQWLKLISLHHIIQINILNKILQMNRPFNIGRKHFSLLLRTIQNFKNSFLTLKNINVIFF